MTSVVGIKYKDGVALAGDTLASYSSLKRYRDIRRLRPVGQYTLIGGTGEYSDFQYIMELLDELMTIEYCIDDGGKLYPKEVWNYLTRVMYNRRNKFNPLWNQLAVAGFRDDKPFLGAVTSHGTSYEDNTIATGYGNYMAQPLLRKAWKPELTRDEAKKLLEDTLRVLYYRDARASNRIQFASVSADGVQISEPYELSSSWEIGNYVKGYA